MFTRYEINFIAIFKSPSRVELIDTFEYLISALTDKGTEFYSLTQTILAKLKEISDDDFAALDMRPDFQEAVKVGDILWALDELEDPEERDDWDESDEAEEWDDQDGLEDSEEWDGWDEPEDDEDWEEMSLDIFSAFEITLMSIFDTTTRLSLISGLTDLLSCLADTETEVKGLIRATLMKLKVITNEVFAAIILDPDWQDVWELADILESLMEEC